MLLDACGNPQWCRRYDNNGLFSAVEFYDVLMEDSIILVSTFTEDYDSNWGVYLLGFDFDGNLLWDKPIASHLLDPLLMEPFPAFLKKAGDDIFIVGDCYYAYPDNPGVFHLRSMFIKLDSLYNKEWFLPYGMTDHILGTGFGVIQLDSNKFRGYGRHNIGNNVYNTIYMDFDKYGNETQHKNISNNNFSPPLYSNSLLALNKTNDSTYYITAQMDTVYTPEDVVMGEFTVDTGGNIVYEYQIHPEIIDGDMHPSVKTMAGQFVTHAVVKNNYRDILLYKLNADLSQAEYDTNTYVYDSLCPHPISSDTIYLDDCDIVTAVPQFPTPQSYYKAKQKVELTAYPNPATGGSINFKLKYTRYHQNMKLTVYDVSGRPMAALPVATGQKEAALALGGFSPGMYVAVVSNGRKILGKAVFAVR